MRKLVLITVVGVLLAGCAVGPEYRKPDLDLPETWPEHTLLGAEARDDMRAWWQRFNDPVLDALVERAAADNLEVRQQAARVLEARAGLGFARAERLPTVGVQAEAAREQLPGGVTPPGVPNPANTFSLAGVLSYEIDLWGRLAREREAATALLEQSVFAHDAVRMNVITEVVTTYFGLRAAELQLMLTEETLVAREQSLRLEQLRFEAGESDQLAVRQAEAELAGTRAQLPAMQRQVEALRGALAILVGASPAEIIAGLEIAPHRMADLVLPETVPAELPSELLERRPDVRAAEAVLVAATARVGIAQAQRLPRFNLSALLGTVAGRSSDLFGSGTDMWNVGASVGVPLLDFGRTRAGVDSAQARLEQAELQYRATVATAFAEVRDALIVYESSGKRARATRDQVEAIQRSLRVAQARYEEGFIGFLQVLDAQRALYGAQLALAEALRDRLTATATLFKALGGGWEAPERPNA